ncbi:aldo/keto reductase [Archangium lansingense]|uniref:HEAT repeat domain-containing protein n=1 Tax=Archangium lansingense TaxID=2995310 RepID=A0ABT4AET1_9BACT|nr:aldo/keto reductase [Archangium lansinium]MCY1080192.1 HEAT repeat domain-containing protein [Archangium lansinium]
MGLLDSAAVRLLDENAEVRREAVDAVDTLVPPGRFALRQALLTDEDAEVRASAARRLGDARDGRFVSALLEALGDPMPSVRDRAWRALARLGAEALLARVPRAIREEPVWWVRRAAIRAAASVAGSGALELLLEALEDPFWRVRNAAVQALAWLGEADALVRQRVRDVADGSRNGAVKAAGAYLEGVWGGAALAPVTPPLFGSELPQVPAGALDNEDPAVVTARLERMPASDVPVSELVKWLGDPHEPLRALARRRLRERREPEALRLALRWLDEPRVPHAADEVRALLERLDLDDVSLASRILDEPPRAGAVGLAAWVAARRAHPGLLERVRPLARHPVPAVRRAALSGLVHDPESRALVLSALEDSDETVREVLLSSWERRPVAPESLEAHARALVVFAPAARSPRERRAVAEAAVFLEDEALLARAAEDLDPSVRAVALAALARRGVFSEAELLAASVHEDPWIRAAVLDTESARAASASDLDPSVRRAAMQLLVSRRYELSVSELRSVALLGAGGQDPWIRARAAELLQVEGEREELSALLRLSLDTSPMVRAAAASGLEACATLDERLAELLHGPGHEQAEDVRVSAYTWLLRRADGPAFERLCAALRGTSEPERVASHLEALTLVFPDEAFAAAPDLERRRPTRPQRAKAGPVRAAPEFPPHSSRRPLGRTGLSVSPLVLSGAHGLSVGALAEAHEAGVNAFFWEPRYMELTRFLRSGRTRRDGLVVVAGTYHSGAEAIRRDVRAALRLLRTDRLDVFLLFWVRSRERLDAENFETLEALRAEGRIRAFGFSTHHRDIALEALRQHPWPVVMTRHSAAHPGAESALFPEALARGTGVLTFTATCYGRLLRPAPGEPADLALPSAVDCYRYALSQPGVGACLSAPRNHRELRQNLEVLDRPWMMPDVLAAMRAHGERVRAGNQRFNALVRQAPGGTRDTLLALLDEESSDF